MPARDSARQNDPVPEAEPLGVVVVSYNTRVHLQECLRTVLAQRPAIIVVADNGSRDGSVEMVQREFPGVIIDLDPTNPGYGAGANRGIRRCAPADVLLLNSDTRLPPGAVAALRSYLDANRRAGLVGPRLVNEDGSLQPSCFRFPTPLRPPCERDPLAHIAQYLPIAREQCLATWSHSRPRVVPAVMGAALAIRREAFEAVGGFDESFFMYAEEIDLSFRMRSAGWQTHFAPVTEIVHVGCASTRQRRAAMLEQAALSSLRFYRRHHRGPGYQAAVFVMRCGMAVRITRDSLRLAWSRDAGRRRELSEDVGVWRRVLVAPSVSSR
jgi:GT2 family glycosyltransferase